MIALIDEAVQQRGVRNYVLASVVLPDALRAKSRAAVRHIPGTPARRFHWHHEDERERQAMLTLVAEAASTILGVTAAVDHLERTRQILLPILVDELPERVTELHFESRQRHNDQRDRVTLIQHSYSISRELAYLHLRSSDEPLLWMADAVAGAILASLRGDGHYVALLPTLKLVRVPPR